MADQAAAAQQVDTLRQDYIVTCMADEGWDYFPIDFAALDAELDGTRPGLSDLEMMLEIGYGITEAIVNPAPEIVDVEFVDPNEQVVENLSSEEQPAYQDDLAGCWDQAIADIPDPDRIAESLRSELEELEEGIASDPRTAQAWADWSACMSDRGFDAPTREALVEDLNVSAAQFTGVDIGPPLPSELQELRDYELDAAAADVECRQDIDAVLRDVREMHEHRFLEEHADRIAVAVGER
jgi:hypothetical protein